MLWNATEKGFGFSTGGATITVPIATNPNTYDQVTYEAWFKLPSAVPSGNNGWLMAQSPDYGWSRAITLNDNRLGLVSVTPSSSGINAQPSVDAWHHVVGVWDQGGPSHVFLDGVKGAANTNVNNGAGTDAGEILNIGGAAQPRHVACGAHESLLVLCLSLPISAYLFLSFATSAYLYCFSAYLCLSLPHPPTSCMMRLLRSGKQRRRAQSCIVHFRRPCVLA